MISYRLQKNVTANIRDLLDAVNIDICLLNMVSKRTIGEGMFNSHKLVVYHHLGLGDHFVCNGLVHHICSQFDEIILPCWRHNYVTVENLYSEFSKIVILPIDNEPIDIINFANNHNLPILQIGFEYLGKTNSPWHDAFYEQYQIPLEYRYSKFHIPATTVGHSLLKQLVPSRDYMLIHNSSSENPEGYPIDILQGRRANDLPQIVKVVPGVSKNLLDWVPVMQQAREIHAVNSSIFWLVDCVPNITADLYYHDIRQTLPLYPSPRWKIISYKNKI